MRNDDRLLVQRAAQGDTDAFAELVNLHQNMVYGLALRKLGNPHDAEEVAQTAFLNAWRGLKAFKGDSSFATWLYRLTSNACIDHLRQNGKHTENRSLEDETLPPLPDHKPGPEEQALGREQQEILRKAIEQLPPEQRTVLLLREMDGLTYEEIAQLLHLELGTVKSRLARARLALRDRLTTEGNFFEDRPSKDTGKGGMRP